MSAEPRKVALVTGGAKRVGRAIVERMAAAGYDIGFTYVTSRDEAAALEEQICATGVRCLSVRTDLSVALVAAEEIDRYIVQKFGRLDVLVNNASVYKPTELG